MGSPFRHADELLARYAECHRDRRNIGTHLVGVPLVLLASGVLFARPSVELGALSLSPAGLAFVLATAWYLTRGQFLLGVAVSLLVGGLFSLGDALAGGSIGAWLGWGLGLLGLGGLLQFLGHYYEGRRPAVAEDPLGLVAGLLVGPMFVTLELLAMAGGFRALVRRIEAHAGPTHLRDLAHPLPR